MAANVSAPAVRVALTVARASARETVSLLYSTYAGMDVGRDNGGVVDLAYEDKAPYAFTGTLKRVVFDLKPAHPEAESDLHQHHASQTVAAGIAG